MRQGKVTVLRKTVRKKWQGKLKAFCYAFLTQLGVTGRRLSEALQVSPAGVHFAFMRGEVFVNGNEKFQKSLAIYLNNLSPSP